MHRKINFGMLLHMVGGLLLLEAIFMLIPLITCIIYRESDAFIFSYTTLITALAGVALWRIRPVSQALGRRDGFLLTASVWVVFSLFGMMPFIFGSSAIDVSSAFFEAMSGFTTTGATTIAMERSLSHGLLIWQAMMQWIGGMGIILFTLALIPALNTSGGMQMFNAEVTGVTHDKIMPRISQTAKALWGLYIFLTLACATLLWLCDIGIFDSVCLALGTISTGGFSPHGDGLNSIGTGWVLVIICTFMLMSGMNFAMVYKSFMGRWRKVRRDEVYKVYLGAIIVFSAAFFLVRLCTSGWHNLRVSLLTPVFQVVSCITSTGYIAPGFAIWQPVILAMIFMMMFSGSCAGSTSGGAKIDRLIYLHRYIKNQMRLVLHPNAILSVRVNGYIVSRELVSKVIAFLCLFMLMIVAGGTVLSLLGLPVVDSYFSSFSCICNTGFGSSITGYGDDYTAIPAAAKWVLSLLMLIGRLEIFTVLILFDPSFWRN